MLKKIAVRVATIFLSLLLCLLLLELTLRTGWFDDKDNPHPIWIPHRFDKIHSEIENNNWQFAKLNTYKFTDRERNNRKNKDGKRIAILGDSFVWGTGIPYELTWNHQLEKMVNEKYNNVEVLSWGFPAWSTMDELSFLENHGLKYDIDMLIVGYVDNDPHMQRIELKVFSWHKSAVAKILKIFFPNAISFIRAYLYNFLFKHFDDYGYSNWVEKLHSDENLHEYAKLLQDFSQFCNSKNIKLIFALTPSNHDEIYRRHFDKIIPLLEQAHIKYIDLYPESRKEYGDINIRKLWANLGDPHPGELLTNLFARQVMDYLEKVGILSMPRQANNRFCNEESLVNTVLMHDDRDIRRDAVRALPLSNDPVTFKQITDALLSYNPEIREAATYALGELNIEPALNPLIEALKDENALVRKSAVLALDNKKDPRIIEPLIMAATQDSDTFVRRRSLLALIKFKNANITEALVQSLKDDFFYNRKTAIIALGKLKDAQAVEPIIDALFDDVDEVRLAAAEALGEIKDARSVNALKSVSLEDDNPLVRDFAAAALKKITGKEYAKYRRKLLRMWQML